MARVHQRLPCEAALDLDCFRLRGSRVIFRRNSWRMHWMASAGAARASSCCTAVPKPRGMWSSCVGLSALPCTQHRAQSLRAVDLTFIPMTPVESCIALHPDVTQLQRPASRNSLTVTLVQQLCYTALFLQGLCGLTCVYAASALPYSQAYHPAGALPHDQAKQHADCAMTSTYFFCAAVHCKYAK